jgi:hypothetical protein
MPSAIADESKEIGTTTLSDALDRLGIEAQCLGIKPFAHQPSNPSQSADACCLRVVDNSDDRADSLRSDTTCITEIF